MRFTIELNAHEVQKASQTGLLDALARLEAQETPAEDPAQRRKQTPAQPPQAAAAPQTGTIPQSVPVEAPQDPAATQATQTVVPVQAVSYTAEQLGKSAMSIADSRGHQVISDLLQRFGVESLTMLPKEQYGAFAAELRNLGAKL